MDQGKKAASLTTTRLSPLAKPFTLNRSTHQPTSSSSLLSPQQPSVHSLGHCSDDPFSSLLDSFRKSNLGSKVGTVPVKTALPVETSAQDQEKSLFEQYPSPEFGKNGDLDALYWSHFDKLEEFSMPTYSSSMTGLGYGSGISGNELSYMKQGQGVDFHESLFGKGNDVGSSVDDGSKLQKGNFFFLFSFYGLPNFCSNFDLSLMTIFALHRILYWLCFSCLIDFQGGNVSF